MVILNMIGDDKEMASLPNPVREQLDYGTRKRKKHRRTAKMAQTINKQDPLIGVLKEYRKANKMRTLGTYEDLVETIEGEPAVVSIKVDGESVAIGFDGKATRLVSSEGRVRTGLPLTDEITYRLQGEGPSIFVGDLYGVDQQGNELPYPKAISLLRNPKTEKDEQRIRVAIHDVLEFNGEDVSEQDYWQKLSLAAQVFGNGAYISPVAAVQADEDSVVQKLWEQEVLGKGHEGLVVKADGSYKLKPVNTLDLAVIGVEESKEHPETIGALLLAFIDDAGNFRTAGKVGTGIPVIGRTEWYKWAQNNAVYRQGRNIYVDPFRGDRVVEVQYRGLNSQALPAWRFAAGAYEPIGKLASTALRMPSVVRVRDDKHVEPDDVRLEQLPQKYLKAVTAAVKGPARRIDEYWSEGKAGAQFMKDKLLAEDRHRKEKQEFGAGTFLDYFLDTYDAPERYTDVYNEINKKTSGFTPLNAETFRDTFYDSALDYILHDIEMQYIPGMPGFEDTEITDDLLNSWKRAFGMATPSRPTVPEERKETFRTLLNKWEDAYDLMFTQARDASEKARDYTLPELSEDKENEELVMLTYAPAIQEHAAMIASQNPTAAIGYLSEFPDMVGEGEVELPFDPETKEKSIVPFGTYIDQQLTRELTDEERGRILDIIESESEVRSIPEYLTVPLVRKVTFDKGEEGEFERGKTPPRDITQSITGIESELNRYLLPTTGKGPQAEAAIVYIRTGAPVLAYEDQLEKIAYGRAWGGYGKVPGRVMFIISDTLDEETKVVPTTSEAVESLRESYGDPYIGEVGDRLEQLHVGGLPVFTEKQIDSVYTQLKDDLDNTLEDNVMVFYNPDGPVGQEILTKDRIGNLPSSMAEDYGVNVMMAPSPGLEETYRVVETPKEHFEAVTKDKAEGVTPTVEEIETLLKEDAANQFRDLYTQLDTYIRSSPTGIINVEINQGSELYKQIGESTIIDQLTNFVQSKDREVEFSLGYGLDKPFEINISGTEVTSMRLTVTAEEEPDLLMQLLKEPIEEPTVPLEEEPVAEPEVPKEETIPQELSPELQYIGEHIEEWKDEALERIQPQAIEGQYAGYRPLIVKVNPDSLQAVTDLLPADEAGQPHKVFQGHDVEGKPYYVDIIFQSKSPEDMKRWPDEPTFIYPYEGAGSAAESVEKQRARERQEEKFQEYREQLPPKQEREQQEREFREKLREYLPIEEKEMPTTRVKIPQELLPDDALHGTGVGQFVPKTVLERPQSEVERAAFERTVNTTRNYILKQLESAPAGDVDILVPIYLQDEALEAYKRIQDAAYTEGVSPQASVDPALLEDKHVFFVLENIAEGKSLEEPTYTTERVKGQWGPSRWRVDLDRFIEDISRERTKASVFPMEELLQTIESTKHRPLVIYVSSEDLSDVQSTGAKVSANILEDPNICIAIDNSLTSFDNNKRFEVKQVDNLNKAPYTYYSPAWPTAHEEELANRDIQLGYEIEAVQNNTPKLFVESLTAVPELMIDASSLQEQLGKARAYKPPEDIRKQLAVNNIDVRPNTLFKPLYPNVLQFEVGDESFLVDVSNPKAAEVSVLPNEFKAADKIQRDIRETQEQIRNARDVPERDRLIKELRQLQFMYNKAAAENPFKDVQAGIEDATKFLVAAPSPEAIERQWLHNIARTSYPYIAGWQRTMQEFGIPLTYPDAISDQQLKANGFSDALTYYQKTPDISPDVVTTHIAELTNTQPESYIRGYTEGILSRGVNLPGAIEPTEVVPGTVIPGIPREFVRDYLVEIERRKAAGKLNEGQLARAKSPDTVKQYYNLTKGKTSMRTALLQILAEDDIENLQEATEPLTTEVPLEKPTEEVPMEGVPVTEAPTEQEVVPNVPAWYVELYNKALEGLKEYTTFQDPEAFAVVNSPEFVQKVYNQSGI